MKISILALLVLAACASTQARKISWVKMPVSYSCFEKSDLKHQLKLETDPGPAPGTAAELWLHPQRSDTRGDYHMDGDPYSREADQHPMTFHRSNLFGTGQLPESLKVDWSGIARGERDVTLEFDGLSFACQKDGK